MVLSITGNARAVTVFTEWCYHEPGYSVVYGSARIVNGNKLCVVFAVVVNYFTNYVSIHIIFKK